MVTAEEHKDVFAHVLKLIGESDDGTGEITKTLKDSNVNNILDLINLKSRVEQLHYKTGKTKVELSTGHKNLLTILSHYHMTRRKNGASFRVLDWLQVDQEQFDEFRLDYDPNDYLPVPTTSAVNTSATTTSVPTNDPVRDFNRGIKRDATLFPQLKDNKQWDSWYIETKAQARAQDIEDILDPTYTPTTAGDASVFDKKQKYMYSVFAKTLQTDKGKALVRDHVDDYDAQAIHKELFDHAQRSTKASVNASDLLAYITTARIGTTPWKGSSESFIINWQDKIRKYEQLVDKQDIFSDSVKRTMLENVVKPIDNLRAVKDQANQFQVRMGTKITYDQYCSLLLSAAQSDDSQYATMVNSKGIRRSVYNHDTSDGPDFIDDPDFIYDIDSDPSYLQVNFHDCNENLEAYYSNSRLSSQQWRNLSDDAKAMWISMDNESKRIILDNKSLSDGRISRRNQGRQPHQRKSDRSVLLHETQGDGPDNNIEVSHNETSQDTHADVENNGSSDNDNTILANMTQHKQLPPGHLQRFLSPSSGTKDRKQSQKSTPKEVTIDGKRYREVHMAKSLYCFSHVRDSRGALVDRGANGGICGSDVRIIHKTGRKVDVQGIDNHQVVDIPIVTAGAVVSTQRGPAVIIMNQYAYIGNGKSIHSCGQMEMFGHEVNDKSMKVSGGLQRINTQDGFCIPLNIKAGLPYMTLRPFTDQEWDNLPHVVLTSDTDWDPTVLDNVIDHDDKWFDALPDFPHGTQDSLFDLQGNYKHRTVVQHIDVNDSDLGNGILPNSPYLFEAYENETTPQAREVTSKEPDYASYIPNFAWQPIDVIKRTFHATTQYARIPMSTHLTRHFKSPFPALNVKRRQESVATDTVYADVPAIDCGHTQAQFYCGLSSLVCDAYGMKTDKQFINTFEDIIRERGAMDRLVSDNAQVETAGRAKDIFRAYVIGHWSSEPHQQHQNYAERKYQHVKNTTNRMMERSGSPANTWLLALLYVCFLLNHTASSVLKWRTPLERLNGTTPDISPLLRFYWWQPVYYKLDDSDFPSETREKRGRFVGIAEHVGHAMTFKILTDDTHKVISRSNVRPADDPSSLNLRLDLFDGEKADVDVIKSVKSVNQDQMMVIKPEDMVGRTFLTDALDNGERHRAHIVKAIEDHQENIEAHPERIKFLCSFNNKQYEEILSYNDIIDRIEKEDNDPDVWKLRRITAHEGPLSPTHPSYKGSSYNVMVEWETGEITSEPLSIIAADDPVTCAIYARQNNLLDREGWKRFRGIAKRQKKLFRMANQAKLRSFRLAPRYKYGFQIPRDFNHAKSLDSKNGNTKWQDATTLEIKQLNDYKTFINLGKGTPAPKGYKKIRVHLIYDIKHDGRHKARCVADGHLTDIPVDSVYSGVVSLRGLRIMLFLAELNQLDTWATDIGNAYLEAETSEKVYIVAGTEFGEEQGATLIIFKALYGLRSSGKRFHDKFADDLRDMGFTPCKDEPDIWMRKAFPIWEYVAVYVDDLAFVMKDPSSFASMLADRYHYKLKGTGSISFHLGCDFFRDEHGVLCMAPRKYIEKMVDGYVNMFGEKPRTRFSSPLEKGDHPELDDSELLDEEGIQKYQSLVGSIQWAVSIGRLDVATAVMTLSGFRSLPRKGHLERAKRVVGYLTKMKHGSIRFRTGIPDYSDLHYIRQDWEKSVYGDVKEAIPHDAPEALGLPVVLTHYVDANLYHDMLTGRSVTGILHFLNQTPIDWFSKKQATAETATYGSEYVAARTCIEQIIALRNTLRYLGVPVIGPSYMFGDNDSVVNSSTKIDAKLHKRHIALSFHRVRESIAADICHFFHLSGQFNPADILSKHWSYNCIWDLLQPLMFWQGDTLDIFSE